MQTPRPLPVQATSLMTAEPAPSTDASTSAPSPPRLPPLFSRFQNLLHPELHPDPSPTRAHNDWVTNEGISSEELNPEGREFLKVRFLTWNMHESLPKGDLTPLLGRVPSYAPPSREVLESGRLPPVPLAESDSATYHIIVVSGQETPTPSGIPLGLAAVKWGAGHSHTSTPSTAVKPFSPLAQPSSPQLPAGGRQASSAAAHANHHPSPLSTSASAAGSTDDLNKISSLPQLAAHPPAFSLSPSSPTPTSDSLAGKETLPAGLPLAHGGPSNLSLQIPGQIPGTHAHSSTQSSAVSSQSTSPTGSIREKGPSPSPADVGLPDTSSSTTEREHKSSTHSRSSEPKGWSDMLEDWFCNRAGEAARPPPPPPAATVEVTDVEDEGTSTSTPVAKQTTPKGPVIEEGQGSYQLVRKERMLGIYLAVFVWRGAAHLLESTSSSHVTTGLIGGRWGNKGGVAIAVKLASKRLLFINSHLAAHASRSDVRLLNVAKIKAELNIDAFLESGDHRILLEDPTDRFDSTFWCGDLNFRLDVSRLHADWLMSRKAYQEAFQFDQLRKIMHEKRGFEGFKEAPIDFPPTYKYDLFKPVKRSSTKSSSRRRKNKSLSEVVEDNVAEQVEDEDGADTTADADSASIVSAGWTSVGQSGYTSDEVDLDDDTAPEPASLQQQSQILAGKMVSETKKLFLPSTVLKGKHKILKLINKPTPSSSPGTASPSSHIASTDKRSMSASYEQRSGSTTSLDLDRRTSTKSTASSHAVAGPSSSSYGSPPPNRLSLDGSVSPPRPAALTRQLSSKIRRSFSGRLDLGNNRDTVSDDDTDDENATGAPITTGLTSDVYDTSAKARVPSWCDRILFKSFESNYPPRPAPPLSTDIERPTVPLSSRLDRFTSALNLRKPGRLNRSVSASSQLSGVSHATVPAERGRPCAGESTASSSQVSLHNPSSSPSRTPHAELPTERSPSQGRSAHVHWGTGSSQVEGDGPAPSASPSRRSSFTRFARRQRSNSLSTPSANSPEGKAGDDDRPPSQRPDLPHLDLHVARNSPHRSLSTPLQSNSPHDSPVTPHRPDISSSGRHISAPAVAGGSDGKSTWLSRLLTTFSHSSGSVDEIAAQPVPQPQVVRRRGEVLALQYGTLNDQDMRVLKGYSDHRPVIGVFALFI